MHAVAGVSLNLLWISVHAPTRAAIGTNDPIPIVFTAIQLLGIWSRLHHNNIIIARVNVYTVITIKMLLLIPEMISKSRFLGPMQKSSTQVFISSWKVHAWNLRGSPTTFTGD